MHQASPAALAAANRARPAASALSDALDLEHLWSTVQRRYRVVLAVAIAVFLLVMVGTVVSRMKFRSVGRLYLGELEENTSANTHSNEIAISSSSQGVVGSEVEIIQSRSLVSRAILDSGLNVTVTDARRAPPRYGEWLLARRNPALLDAATAEVRGVNSTLSDKFAKERSYQIRFLSDTEYEAVSDQQRARGRLGEPLQVPGASLTLLAGGERPPNRDAVYDVTVRSLQEVTSAVLSTLQVSSSKPLPPAQPVNVVTVEFAGESPRMTAAFLESLMGAYLNARQSWKAEDATAAEKFVVDQLRKTRESLDEIQKKLAVYRSNNRVVVMDNEAKAMIEQIGKYEEQRVSKRLEVAALSELDKSLRGPNPPVTAFLLGQANDTVIERMASSLSEARQKYTDLESRFNEASPELRAQREQVDSQLQAIRTYVKGRSERARENLGTLDGIIKQFEVRLDTVPGAEVGLAQLTRESDVYDRMYSYLLERQQQTAIIKASTLSKNRILDAPEVAGREDSPKLFLRLASLPLGLLVGVLLVLVGSLLSRSLQSETDARAAAAGSGVLASLPRRKAGFPRSMDILGRERNSAFAEALRTLRTRLYQLGSSPAGKVVLISSPNAGDGKTTCALALASLLAADRKRVLVVDADLRKANHPGADAVGTPGLGQIARNESTWADALRRVPTASGEFYVIGSGGRGPSELLSYPSVAEFLAEARAQFDFVLLDAASFPLTSDALVLARHADASLSVLRLHNSSRKAANEHLTALAQATPAHAVVLNELGLDRFLEKPQRKQPVMTSSPSRPSWRPIWWLSALILFACAAAFLLTGKAVALGALTSSRSHMVSP